MKQLHKLPSKEFNLKVGKSFKNKKEKKKTIDVSKKENPTVN